MLYLRAVHLIRRPDPPEGSDRTQPENRVTRSSHWSEVGHLFQKPTLAGRSRFSSPKTRSDLCTKNFQQKISRFQQKFPDSGEIFQIPASNFQIPTSNFQILVTKFHISATYQVDLVIFHPNLVKSHRIQRDLTRSSKISTGFGVFCLKSTILAGILPWTIPTEPTLFPAQNQPRRSDSLVSRQRVKISSTRFYQVGIGLGTNPTRTNPWTPLLYLLDII